MGDPSREPHRGEDEAPGPGEPRVTQVLDGDRVRLTVVGELTEPARRPLIRALTDLLLQEASLRRVELDLRAVEFMNSAGLAVLVQMMRLGAPRGIPVILVGPSPAVTRPLRLSGLWYRFEVIDGDDPETDG